MKPFPALMSRCLSNMLFLVEVPILQFHSYTTRGIVLKEPKPTSVALFPVPNWPNETWGKKIITVSAF